MYSNTQRNKLFNKLLYRIGEITHEKNSLPLPLLSPFVPQLEDNGLLTPLQASTIPAPVSAQTPADETPPATPPAQTTAPTFRIPQTGDAARPALLLVLALCSAVLFVLLWRKKDKK